jgi:high-affinity Fe2+/Pb2+ permease
VDKDINATRSPEEQSVPLIYKLLVVAVMVAMVAAAMLFVLLVRIG